MPDALLFLELLNRDLGVDRGRVQLLESRDLIFSFAEESMVVVACLGERAILPTHGTAATDMNIDTSLYPDRPAPTLLETPQDKADYLRRVCGAFDLGLPPTADTIKARREWKDIFDAFALRGSPAYHALRSLYGWEELPRLPYLSKPHYQVLDEIEGRTDNCEHLV